MKELMDFDRLHNLFVMKAAGLLYGNVMQSNRLDLPAALRVSFSRFYGIVSGLRCHRGQIPP
jgi:hypothetical protein